MKTRFDKLKARPKRLEIKHLTKTLDSRAGEVVALQNIDLTVYRREFMCVLGQSGCGKSTLVRILTGLETPSSGEVLVDGNPVTGPDRRAWKGDKTYQSQRRS